MNSKPNSPSVIGSSAPANVSEKSIQPQTPVDLLFFQPEILDQLHDSIIITDMSGTITGCNQAASRVFGYAQQELIGQNASILYQDKDLGTLRPKILQAVREKGQISMEMCSRTKSGAEIFLHLTVTLLRDGGAQPVGMVGLSQDITQRKLTERALRQSDQRFQGLVQVCPDFIFTARNDGWSDWVSQNFYEY